ncbi:hypothetical protein SeLEV6574_g04577 [Synchytrium endobioticum]|uniref:Uncharacterized protein n=1 Tax=Synchytrium endobioticum TaxID=286115 RepID=A0A507CYT2_9FUNG|nr:hypothetical protein SeLEV6574_g04577 [Synchytrium endobioticum]
MRTAEIDVEPKSMTVLKDGGVKITVHVKPGAKITQVTDVTNDAVGISLAAQAREGEANQELIGFLSETLGVKKYEVSIIAGHKSREKTIRRKHHDGLLAMGRIRRSGKSRIQSRPCGVSMTMYR